MKDKNKTQCELEDDLREEYDLSELKNPLRGKYDIALLFTMKMAQQK